MFVCVFTHTQLFMPSGLLFNVCVCVCGVCTVYHTLTIATAAAAASAAVSGTAAGLSAAAPADAAAPAAAALAQHAAAGPSFSAPRPRTERPPCTGSPAR